MNSILNTTFNITLFFIRFFAFCSTILSCIHRYSKTQLSVLDICIWSSIGEEF